jgi:bifunctional DNA-binding transcriptional regulator/antitoxin component of YhaV-PrlF toxin-antitoxin module
VKISLEICEKLGWKEGDRIVELVDEEKKAVILIKREDYEKLIGGEQ